MKNFSIKGYTLVELVIAISISTTVLAGLIYFVTQINMDINIAQRKTNLYTNLSDFVATWNMARNNYSTGLVINAPGGKGYDTVILTNSGKTSGMLIGVVNMSLSGADSFLDSFTDYDTYGNKMLAIQEIGSGTLSAIYTNTGAIFSVPIHGDKTYPYLHVTNFLVQSYNSGAVLDVNIDTYINDYPGMYGQKLSSIGDVIGDVFSFNLNF